MIQPDRTLVDAADLQAVKDAVAGLEAGAFPPLEWEPTDGMRQAYRRLGPHLSDEEVEEHLETMHQVGLL